LVATQLYSLSLHDALPISEDLTKAIIDWYSESLAALVTFISTAASPLIDPDIKSSPIFLSTGTDSPVKEDWSKLELPLMISPSTGTWLPGLINTISPIFKSSTLTSSILPLTNLSAILGEFCNKERNSLSA